MKSFDRRADRVNRYLVRRVERLVCKLAEHVSDPRSRQGRRWDLSCLLFVLLVGMVAGRKTLRAVESLSHRLPLLNRGRKVDGVPDTTLANLVAVLEPMDFEPVLVDQVRRMQRRGQLAPQGLPIGICTVDGKSLGVLNHDANGWAQRGRKTDGTPYFHVMVHRAVLSSAGGKPCILQGPVDAGGGEVSSFPGFAGRAWALYGRFDMFDAFDVDAGMVSRGNFEYVDQHLQTGFIGGLKGNQPELYREAKRVLEPMMTSAEPEAVSAWEPHQGREIRRKLFRTAEMNGFNGWDNLRQVWLVVQETREEVGGMTRPERRRNPDVVRWRVTTEHRYFVTNLPWRRLKPQQILLVVRNHWAVENDCFNSLDLQWREDRPAWCGDGNASLVLGMLRILAYNLVQHLRKCHVKAWRPRLGRREPETWSTIFALVESSVVLWLLEANDRAPPDDIRLLTVVYPSTYLRCG